MFQNNFLFFKFSIPKISFIYRTTIMKIPKIRIILIFSKEYKVQEEMCKGAGKKHPFYVLQSAKIICWSDKRARQYKKK